MRLHCAVLEIPAKSSVPPGSPLNKLRPLLTRSESTLPPPLIPLHFISFRCNAYRKLGEGSAHPSHKGLQLVTSHSLFLRTRTNIRNPNPLIHLLHNSRTPPGWGVPGWDSQSWRPLSQLPEDHRSRITGHRTRVTDHGPRNTGHRPTGPPVPLRRNPQSARITPVAYALGSNAARKLIRSRRCLIY